MGVKSLLFILAASLTFGCELKYSELEKIGASCPPYDTCSIPRETESLMEHRCLCSANCIKSRTCCIDSPHVRISQKGFRTRGTCQMVANENILAVSNCDPRWRGSREIRLMCENSISSLRDPISILPVTNLQTGTTYSNYFCAYCNNEAQFSSPWTIQLESNVPNSKQSDEFGSDRDVIMDRLIFDEERNQWGVIERTLDGGEIFYNVYLNFVPKKEMHSLLVQCVPNMVSDCDAHWKDVAIRKMCRAYMAMVPLNPDSTVYNSILYRNIHCAICNYVNFNSSHLCLKPALPGAAYKPPMSLTLLLDINLSDGDKVGHVKRCGSGEMYDSFFKKCRALKCAFPGYTIKENKCVKS